MIDFLNTAAANCFVSFSFMITAAADLINYFLKRCSLVEFSTSLVIIELSLIPK